MRVFLSGPMGAGKSTAAALCARRFGFSVVDLDRRIEQAEGRPVAAIFREDGERAFRAIERREAMALIAERDDVVVALGGGTVADPSTRRALLDAGVVVTLRAGVDELVRRVGADDGRPLLHATDPRAALSELVQERAGAYAECHGEVVTDGLAIEQVASAVAAIVDDPPVLVPLGERSYRVEIGVGVRSRVGSRTRGASRVVLVGDAGAAPWVDEARACIAAAGTPLTRVTLPGGDANKTLDRVASIWDSALDHGVDRGALVLGVGGGVVGDLAGFAASTLLRGVALGQVPTTLLSMVDSSVGGKTGFNRRGKNLIGTFHQPRFVLCDVEVLSTLPDGERIAGLAEVAKAAWIDGEPAVAELERDAAALRAGERSATLRAIRRAVRLKARVVRDDERESGRRRVLNLGHTIGHALEASGGYRDRHGEAVARGMVAAFRVAERRGAGAGPGERMTALLARLGLPVDLDERWRTDMLSHVEADKKRDGDHVAFVVPGAPGTVRVERLTLAEIGAALSPGA